MRTRRAGFTLLELMIALTAGGIAISSIYAVGAASTRHFHQQLRVANMQTGLRFAMDQLKRDIQRAGFLATPNANVPGESCAPVGPPLDQPTLGSRMAGVSRFDDGTVLLDALKTTPNGLDPGTSTDAITLLGNYATSAEYPGIKLGIVNTNIGVSQDFYGFRRDFHGWVDGPAGLDAAVFKDAFLPGRAIRIGTQRGLNHFAIITLSDGPATAGDLAQINFTPGVPSSCRADMENAWVAPLSFMRWSVANATGESNEVVAGTFGRSAQLLRFEADPLNKSMPLGSAPSAVILDYVVDFNLSFVLTTNTAPGEPDIITPGVSTSTDPDIWNNPQLIRTIIVDLAVRSPNQDPGHPLVAAPPLRSFQVFDDRPGAARVRTLHAEIFVPNIAFKGY